MIRRLCNRSLPVIALLALGGCASAAAPAPASTPRATAHRSSPTPAPTIPGATPKPVPPGPYGVVVTNNDRQGSAYDVLIVDALGDVVARTTAKLPLLKPNQTDDLPLVSASSTRVYYRDGDTDIRSLKPGGATALVRSIPAGAASIIGFAVSPDDSRIAVAVINQAKDLAQTNGRGYVEDLASATNHVDLFANTAADSFRWPVAWHGNGIIDVIGSQYCDRGYGISSCVGSYHVIDSVTGNRLSTLCETPSQQPTESYDSYQPQGVPTAAGIACSEFQGANGVIAGTLLSVDWNGHESSFLSVANGGIAVSGCFLSPDGTVLACSAGSSGALTLVTSDGASRNVGRRYSILGWIDNGHLLVQVDTNTLGVLSPGSGAVSNIALPSADKATLAGDVPSGL